MKLKFTILTILLVTSFSMNAQNYEKLWNEVEALELQGKVKTANEKVTVIYNKAKKKKHHEQLIKSLFYLSKFSLELQEDAELKIVALLEQNIQENSFPTNAILTSVLADIKWQYYQNNRWQIYNRTHTENEENTDFRTWDLNTLFTSIHNDFKTSISQKEKLQNIAVEDYEYILITHKEYDNYRPTLYDILAWRALDFFKQKDHHIIKPKQQFLIDSKDYYLPTKAFITLQPKTTDTILSSYEAIKTFQALEAFHLGSKNYEALIDTYFNRISFVNNQSTLTDKETLYLNAVTEMYRTIPKGTAHAIFKLHYAQALYNYNDKETAAVNRIKALELVNEVLNQYPKSSMVAAAKELQKTILNPSLTIQNEEVVPSDAFSKLSVTYKNASNLYLKIYPVAQDHNFYNHRYAERDSVIAAFFKNNSPKHSLTVTLPKTSDYYSHTTEVILPKLSTGKYIVFASPTPDGNTEKLFAWNYITTSNLACITSSYQSNKTFRVLDRVSGKPIANALVSFGSTSKRTNSDGEATFSWSRNNKKVVISYKDDVLHLGHHYHYNYRDKHNNDTEQSKKTTQAFLFLDRSIYRPGQTVYFKAIVLQRQNKKTSVLANTTFNVSVKDANYQEIKQFKLTTNAFGSFTEQFEIPKDVLTGNFLIQVHKDDNVRGGQAGFSVEEYKRPKFEVTFNPVSETYQVDQEVCAKGNADALLGTPITGAKVTYNVIRKTQFSHWRYWSDYYSNETKEIAQGETTTDENGKFEISFIAQPDKSKDPKGLPVFSYEVTANVTDINGETRTATSTINVGYHTLAIGLETPEKWNTNKTSELSVTAKNLNNTAIASELNIAIYKLKAPDRILRNRKLPVPELPMVSKETFIEKFPHEAYTNEHDIKHWEKGKKVFDQFVKTDTTLTINPTPNWESGNYIIVATGKDKFNNTVTQEKTILLTNDKDTYLPDQQLFDYEISNASQIIKDKQLDLLLKSGATDVHVLVEAYYNNNLLYKETVQVNGKTLVRIPFKNQPKLFNSSIALQFSFIKYNEHHLINKTVPLPDEKDALVIETKSFRDKLQPGAKETWSFTIKNKDNTRVASEILASMYDSALDQFKPHNWQSDLHMYYYYRNNIARKESPLFGITSFKTHNIPDNYRFSYQIIEPRIKAFGFSLDGSANYNYLYNLKNKSYSRDDIPKGMVSGIVTDESGLPLVNATILIKGTTTGTTTNFDGEFSIAAKKKDILQISFVGYETKEIRIREHNYLHIPLNLSDQLEEVVVTAVGRKRGRKTLGYAVTEVAEEEMSMDNVGNALQGKLVGIGISDSTGLSGSTSDIIIRGYSSLDKKAPLIILNGFPININENNKESNTISLQDIVSVETLSGIEATTLYGAEGRNGVIIIKTSNNITKASYKALLDLVHKYEKSFDFSNIKSRTNFNETAFFFPQLTTNKNGDVSFSFEAPETLTRWKLQLFGHTKTGVAGKHTAFMNTQKELMVVPNPPRFLRANDRIVFQSKIVSLSNKTLNGTAKIELFDALTGQEIHPELLKGQAQTMSFQVPAKGNTVVAWELEIPESLGAVTYRILAKAGTFTDGEEDVLPVLTNRMLVTESIPITVRSNSKETYTLSKLRDNTSSTLHNHQLTLEYTTNPTWYAIQSLPYLMEFPYECAEQTFSRYYANTLGSYIINSNPKIKTVFDTWKANGQLNSKLELNEELKQVLIAETPWLRDAQSEAERKKQLAILFDLERMRSEEQRVIRKLQKLQKNTGGFPWFDGGNENYYITRHIISGMGHLKQLGVLQPNDAIKNIYTSGLRYTDKEFHNIHNRRLKYQKEEAIVANNSDIHYLYARSFFNKELPIFKQHREVYDLYLKKIQKNWLERSLLEKTMIAIVLHRNGNSTLAEGILTHLKETAIVDQDKGMYWKSNTAGWYWYQAPIETQAMIIEAFSEITNDKATVEELQIWLLNNKRKNDWNTTKATTEAVYALLLQGNDWISLDTAAEITVGKETIKTAKTTTEAGTGYLKKTWDSNTINEDMATVTVKNKSDVIQFGGYYWQYFEQLDKITNEHEKNDLVLQKQLFKKQYTDAGEQLIAITENTPLEVGDLVTVKLTVHVKDHFEFVHLKDMRAAGFEPVDVLSSYRWQDGTGYYQSTKDTATHFFFDYLRKGTYVLTYDVRANNAGDFSNGISTIQSMYAPEFSSHSKGIRVTVK